MTNTVLTQSSKVVASNPRLLFADLNRVLVSCLAASLLLATGCGSSGPTVKAPAPNYYVASPGNGEVTLSWAPSPGATSYDIYYSDVPGVTAENGVKSSGITGTSFTQTGLLNGTRYFFIVKAINGAGVSRASAQAAATPTSDLPNGPDGLTAVTADSKVLLTWAAGSNATHYNIYYGTSPLPLTSGARAAATASRVTIFGLTKNTPYYFVVTSVNAQGESGPSKVISATPSAGTVTLAPA